jgi:hypothetical protein
VKIARSSTLVAILATCAITAAGQQSSTRQDVQPILSAKVPSYTVKAMNLLQAAAQIASDFNLPMGIEWQGDPDTRKEIIYQWQNATVQKILYDVSSFDVQYQVNISNGVVHLWKGGIAGSPRNPLNITIRDFSVADTYAGQARSKLQDRLNQMMFPPSPTERRLACAGSYGAGAGDRLISLSMKDATAREILDAILLRSEFAIWLTVFPDKQAHIGYLQTTPPWRKTIQQPDIDLVGRYYDPATGKSRGDWKIGLKRE